MKAKNGYKKCSSKNCSEVNPQLLDNFSKDKNSSDGFYHRCKKCRNKYVQDNKNKLYKSAKKYGEAYRSNPNHIITANERASDWHKSNRQKAIEKMAIRRASTKEVVDAISVFYGCNNVDCCWKGKFHSCQLDFHHFDPKQKTKPISVMYGCSKKRIAKEINKCIVLCSNCHRLFHNTLFIVNETMLCCVNDDLEIIK